jgi:hypothetical protein
LSIAEFQFKSASSSELVLPLSEALEALQLMAQSGVSVLGWDGWLRYPDGKLGHSQQHQGTASAPQLSQAELYAWFRSTMQDSQVEHHHNPEVSGSELLFCITYQA